MKRAWFVRCSPVTILTLAGGMGIHGMAAETLPAFELSRWKTGERVRLEDFAGRILVLDFFAYWCAPCERASRDLEQGVQQFYAARNGNPHGVPVRVVSVNIERDSPERTEEFLRSTGAGFVVNDVSGSLLRQLGGSGIPFLAIVDGSASRAGQPNFPIVYKHAGFEGDTRLRQIIDHLGSGSPSVQVARSALFQAPVSHVLEPDGEFVWTRDIQLTESRLRYAQEAGDTSWDASFSYASMDVDYRPFRLFDFFGFEEELHEDRFGGQVNIRQRLSAPLTVSLAGGLYDGYPDYRRVWIANRFRQKYANPPISFSPAYVEPDPKGWHANAGARWEYLPAVGFADVRAGYAYDRTAPGYEEIETPQGAVPHRGREQLDSALVNASSENVLTPWLRSLNELSWTLTTDRDLRFSYRGSINVAAGERFSFRGYGGITTEAPQFDAWFIGVTAEYEPAPRLLLSVTGRYYNDNGEIIDPSLTSSAAPPLKSWEVGLGLRYTWGRSSFKLYGGPFWTDYAPVVTSGAEFYHLYGDRNWGLAQIAYSLQF